MALVMQNIVKSFGQPPIQILKGISGEIQKGELVSIVGRSGSGKSTLLYILSSLDRPTSGDITIEGQSLVQMNPIELHQFRNLKMGFVFQFHYLLPELTALENVLMPARKCGQLKEKEKFALELFKEFELSHRQDYLPGKMSGGEQQRVAIARALIMDPQYIFADEPTGNLDSRNGEIVMALFARINKERGTTVIYVTHDQQFATLATRQLQMVDGQIAPSE